MIEQLNKLVKAGQSFTYDNNGVPIPILPPNENSFPTYPKMFGKEIKKNPRHSKSLKDVESQD